MIRFRAAPGLERILVWQGSRHLLLTRLCVGSRCSFFIYQRIPPATRLVQKGHRARQLPRAFISSEPDACTFCLGPNGRCTA
jgi:hypothetical protein